ncbi:hypothetical protein P12x_000362 [Tundrisphaera lichenicola]|uniref:hypothetical protein n=1 Tax=Tundrisphaera lichenicola TaxID=2029860 RepID=UPI003EC0699A
MTSTRKNRPVPPQLARLTCSTRTTDREESIRWSRNARAVSEGNNLLARFGLIAKDRGTQDDLAVLSLTATDDQAAYSLVGRGRWM